MPAPKSYSWAQIALHWIIAALIMVQLTVNADMQRAFAQRLSGNGLPDNAGATFHTAIGILVLILALLRLAIRMHRGTPQPPKSNHALINLLGHATHMLLYGFLFFMPLTGALAWFTGIETAAILHELGRLILIPAILLHVAGAIVEQVVLGHPTINRMLHPSSK